MKICSLLPSATEILFELGLGDQVCGVSHECDFPPEARSKSVLIKSRISHTESAAAIDRQVREFLERGESLYSVDFEQLRAIGPDIIVTQDLCHVCAATPDDLGVALAHLKRQPRIVTLNPHSLADVCADIRTVGHATGRTEQADALVADFEAEIAKVESSVAGLHRPRVLCNLRQSPIRARDRAERHFHFSFSRFVTRDIELAACKLARAARDYFRTSAMPAGVTVSFFFA